MYQQPVQQFGMYPGPQQAQHLHMQQYQMQQMQMQQMHMQQMQMQVRTASDQALCTHSCIDVHLQEVVRGQTASACLLQQQQMGVGGYGAPLYHAQQQQQFGGPPNGAAVGSDIFISSKPPSAPRAELLGAKKDPTFDFVGVRTSVSCCVIALCVDT